MKKLALAACLALPGVPLAAETPGYPLRPIRLLVGFTAGGSADASARVIAGRIGHALGTTIVIENRGGAAGAVAGQIASRAAPDGYTLFWSSAGALTVSQILEKNL